MTDVWIWRVILGFQVAWTTLAIVRAAFNVSEWRIVGLVICIITTGVAVTGLERAKRRATVEELRR